MEKVEATRSAVPSLSYQSLRKFVPSAPWPPAPSLPFGTEEKGRGEEALGKGDTVGMGGAPLSPALSPFVPHGARETDALLVTAIPARTFATINSRALSVCIRVYLWFNWRV